MRQSTYAIYQMLAKICSYFILIGTIAAAQPAAVAGQELWGGMKVGMTEAEVKALHPTRKIELSPGCIAQVKPYYENKRVASVDLLTIRTSRSRSCGETLLESLRNRYGPPRTERNYKADLCTEEPMCDWGDALFDPKIGKHNFSHTSWFTGELLIAIWRDLDTNAWQISFYAARLAEPASAPKL